MISDDELLLYYYRDGLDAAERARIGAALSEQPELAQRLQALVARLDAAAAHARSSRCPRRRSSAGRTRWSVRRRRSRERADVPRTAVAAISAGAAAAAVAVVALILIVVATRSPPDQIAEITPKPRSPRHGSMRPLMSAA